MRALTSDRPILPRLLLYAQLYKSSYDQALTSDSSAACKLKIIAIYIDHCEILNASWDILDRLLFLPVLICFAALFMAVADLLFQLGLLFFDSVMLLEFILFRMLSKLLSL